MLVIGTQQPWIEAVLLEKGAHHITTLEYAPIDNRHPNITVITPDQMRDLYRTGKFTGPQQKFDAVVSFSSLEHSGLGRSVKLIPYM